MSKKKPATPRLSPWDAPSRVEVAVGQMIERMAPYGIRSRAQHALLNLGVELAQHKSLADVEEQLRYLYECLAENWGDS